MIKKLILSSIMASFTFNIAIADTYYNIITEEHNKYSAVIVAEAFSHSCKEILDKGESIGDGNYQIVLNDQSLFDVYCDMTTNGGGWTRLDKSVLETPEVFDFVSTSFSGFQYLWESGNLVLGDEVASTGHDTRLDITLPFSYGEFYLKDYAARAKKGVIETGTSLMTYNWENEVPLSLMSSGWGDILFGSSDNSKPTTSYTKEGFYHQTPTGSDIIFPNSDIHSIGIVSDVLSIRSVEGGGEDEDLYIWHSGYIFVR